jgi:hypothetical protein
MGMQMNKGDFRAFTGLRHFGLAYGVPGDFGKVMAFLAII